jgi:hypothetical protein
MKPPVPIGIEVENCRSALIANDNSMRIALIRVIEGRLVKRPGKRLVKRQFANLREQRSAQKPCWYVDRFRSCSLRALIVAAIMPQHQPVRRTHANGQDAIWPFPILAQRVVFFNDLNRYAMANEVKRVN